MESPMSDESDDSEGSTTDEVENLHRVEAPRPMDQIYQAFPNEAQRFAIDPNDGLPRLVIPHTIADALPPHLSVEHFVCMADTSKYVLRDGWGDIIARFEPSEVELMLDGRTRVRTSLACERAEVMGPAFVRRRWLGRLLSAGAPRPVDVERDWIVVEAIRPACKHYARQLQPFPLDPTHRSIMRLCTARRVDYGDFLAVGDQLMFACDLRSPPLGGRHDLAEAFDERSLADARAAAILKAEEDGTAAGFDLDAELDAELYEQEGIFKN
jgi:hypothetical protein